MPAFSYYSKDELERYRKGHDKDLQELLDEANQISDKWAVHKTEMQTYSYGFKNKPIPIYTLLYGGVDAGEAQIVNFYGGESSINHNVSKSDICNFLMGWIGGVRCSVAG